MLDEIRLKTNSFILMQHASKVVSSTLRFLKQHTAFLISCATSKITVNVDLEKLGAYSEIGDVNKLHGLFSVSPEINNPYTGKNFFDFVKRHKIGEVHF